MLELELWQIGLYKNSFSETQFKAIDTLSNFISRSFDQTLTTLYKI